MVGKGSLVIGGWATICAAAIGVIALADFASAGPSLEERKLPMKFTWNVDAAPACEPQCSNWIAAVGTITGDTYAAFEEFTANRDVRGAAIVLDSGGGSVLDAIKLGRRWRELKLSTTVGIPVELPSVNGKTGRATIMPEAYCESMCVFLLLSGVNRYVPPGAHVRVHQIWMGDRAEDARAASYTAQDVSIIERDLGRLAKYTFEMGGSGDLLELALSVPPWKPLRQLSSDEIRRSNLANVDSLAEILPGAEDRPMVSMTKPVQERFVPEAQKTAAAKPAESVTVSSERQ